MKINEYNRPQKQKQRRVERPKDSKHRGFGRSENAPRDAKHVDRKKAYRRKDKFKGKSWAESKDD